VELPLLFWTKSSARPTHLESNQPQSTESNETLKFKKAFIKDEGKRSREIEGSKEGKETTAKHRRSATELQFGSIGIRV
jgi:hypothetical protein